MLKIDKEKGIVTVINSYSITDEGTMIYALCIAGAVSITGRSIDSLIREWKAHNILYKLGLFTSHTKDTDFERKEKSHRRIAYFMLAPFYHLIFYK